MVQRPRPPHRPRHDGPRRAPPPAHAHPPHHDRSSRGLREADERHDRPGSADAELTSGLRAGLALVAARPDDVLRVAYARDVRHELGPLLHAAAARSLPCREMPAAELDRLAGSGHHEGLLVEARPRRWLSTGELADLLVRVRGTALALDRVRNPYNVGAALRGAAFFGVDAALLGAPAPHPGLPPTAVRVAEGGVERVALARTTDLADTLGRLRSRGVMVVGTDGEATEDALAFAFARPTVLVMGNEREGLGDRVRAQCDAVVAIRGSGAVESLNVAVAAGVLSAAMTRRH